ncbi:MAG: hypothetical protein ACI8TX_003635, partial [Hyphomicrobiaceae bacterium]
QVKRAVEVLHRTFMTPEGRAVTGMLE